MPLISTRGAASAQGFGEFAQSSVPNYIEDVFSTWLYTGNGSTQTITNGIDLSTKGGMTWIKTRSNTVSSAIYDTNRGALKLLTSNTTNAQSNGSSGMGLSSFNTTGFSLDADTVFSRTNVSGYTYASWTFRKQPKFFDVVTFTGTGSARTIAHSLGSTPGCIFVKRTDLNGDWYVYHNVYGGTGYYVLNSTAAAVSDSTIWNDTNPTSTVFSVGTGNTNINGATYVAYLFANNAGGFGLTGTDNVISCGSFSTNASGVRVQSLGYEPQWILIKRASGGTGGWYMFDTMRGWTMSNDALLYADLSDSETSSLSYGNPTATGFETANLNGSTTFLYIAIRRGPMKVPTSGTSIFSPVARTGTFADATVSTGFPVDMTISSRRASPNFYTLDRLRGSMSGVVNNTLITWSTGAESNGPFGLWLNGSSSGYNLDGNNDFNASGGTYITWNFRRAPSFFDEVCFSTAATVSAPITQNHNLGVAPELVITKRRNSTSQWFTVCAYGITTSQYVTLETTDQKLPYAGGGTSTWSADSTTVTLPSGYFYTSSTYVYYLFATCPGVSKVGSYTGTGALQTINCGFAAGARFVLIKRTDSTGAWYVYDSARGITSGNDPYLLLNTNLAEVTGTNYVDTTAVGFQVTAAAPAGLNASGGTYIFLAIA